MRLSTKGQGRADSIYTSTHPYDICFSCCVNANQCNCVDHRSFYLLLRALDISLFKKPHHLFFQAIAPFLLNFLHWIPIGLDLFLILYAFLLVFQFILNQKRTWNFFVFVDLTIHWTCPHSEESVVHHPNLHKHTNILGFVVHTSRDILV